MSIFDQTKNTESCRIEGVNGHYECDLKKDEIELSDKVKNELKVRLELASLEDEIKSMTNMISKLDRHFKVACSLWDDHEQLTEELDKMPKAKRARHSSRVSHCETKLLPYDTPSH